MSNMKLQITYTKFNYTKLKSVKNEEQTIMKWRTFISKHEGTCKGTDSIHLDVK